MLSNLRERMQTDLLRIIKSTDDQLSAGTNIDDIERPWKAKMGVLMNFSVFRLRRTLREHIFAEISGDRPRKPAYEIILMLSRVS